MTPREYCEQRSAAAGFSHLYRFAFVNDEQHLAVLALRGLEHQFDELIEQTSDSSVAMTQAQWWTEEFTRLESGEPRHPLTKSLLETHSSAIPVKTLNDWLCATGFEIEQPVSEDENTWNERLALRAGCADQLIACVLGLDSDGFREWQPGYSRVRRLARAALLLGQHLRNGYVPVALDRFEQHDLKPGLALAASARGAATELSRSLISQAMQELTASIDAAVFENCERAAPLLATAAVLHERLKSIDDPGEVLDGEVELTALRQVWIVRGARRRAKKNAR